MNELNKIYCGDALETLKTLESESVDCVITSPPYWQLRDYGIDGQLGLESDFHEYIEKLLAIFDEVHRVLKSSGTCFVVIGDTYSSSGCKIGHSDPKREKYNGNGLMLNGRNVESFPKKCLLQIPSRFSIGMTDRGLGWILRNEIIWHKPNAMPDSVTDRFTIDFEKVYFFTKSERYNFEQVKEKMLTLDTNQPRGSIGVLGNQNGGRRKQDNAGNPTYTGFNDRYEIPDDLMRNKRCVWSVSTFASNIRHFAMFPMKLIEPMVLAGCPENGVILDPFIGSGTTGIVALRNQRHYIGIELNAEYAVTAQKRIDEEAAQTTIFTDFDELNEKEARL